MPSPLERAQGIAWKVVAWQLLAGVAVAAPCWYAGPRPALAAIAGGASAALGSAAAAWQHFGAPGESAQRVARRFVAAVALRWVVTAAMLYLAIGRFGLPPQAVLGGLVAALLVYVVALRWQ